MATNEKLMSSVLMHSTDLLQEMKATVEGFKQKMNEHPARIEQRILLQGFEAIATSYDSAMSIAPLQDPQGSVEASP
nr:hypothetical protein Itr_chr07CG07120 [Ipomoea trifida]